MPNSPYSRNTDYPNLHREASQLQNQQRDRAALVSRFFIQGVTGQGVSAINERLKQPYRGAGVSDKGSLLQLRSRWMQVGPKGLRVPADSI